MVKKNSRKANITAIAKKHPTAVSAVGISAHLASKLIEHTAGYFIFCLDADKNLIIDSSTDCYADKLALESSIDRFSAATKKMRERRSEAMMKNFSDEDDNDDNTEFV